MASARGFRGGGLLLFVVAVAYFAALAPYGLNLDDEGTLIYQIYRTYLGQTLYVDFHAGYTPGIYRWNTTLFSLFGVNVVVLRLCLAAINGLSVYLMYWLARRLGTSGAAAAAGGLLYLAFIPFYDGQFAAFNIPYPIWYVTLFWQLSVVCVVRWWETGRGSLWLAAGLCAGIVFGFKPNSGLLNLAALLMALCLLEVPRLDPARRPGRGARLVARSASIVRWLIPLALTVALTDLFARGAGARGVLLFAAPLIVLIAYKATLTQARSVARQVAPAVLWRNLVLLSLGFAAVTLPWVVYFWMRLGTMPALRAILFVGTGFDRFYYMAYPPIGAWGLALSAALGAAFAVGVLMRRRVLSPRIVTGGLVAGLIIATVWLIRHPPPMVEGFQSSVVMRVRDIAFVLIQVTQWAALLVYGLQTWRGRALSLVQDAEAGARAGAGAYGPRLGVLLILLLSGTLTHMQLYPRSDFMHLVPASPGILILGAWLLHLFAQVWARGMARTKRGRTLVASAVALPVYALVVVLVAPALGRISYLARAWWERDDRAVVWLDRTRAPLVLEPAAARPFLALGSTARYLREHSASDDTVFAFPALDIVSFLADRQNPTRHGYFFPGWPGHDVEAEVLDALRARPPRYIVALHDHSLFFGHAPVYYAMLRRHVRDNYRLERRFDTLDVLGPTGATAERQDRSGEATGRLRDTIALWHAELEHNPGPPARTAAAALKGLTAADVPGLAAALGAAEPDAQEKLARLIRKSRSAEGAAAIALLLENYTGPPELRELFFRVVAELGDAGSLPPLLRMWQAADSWNRWALGGLMFTAANKSAKEQQWFAPPDPGAFAAFARTVDLDLLIQWIDNPWESPMLRSFAIRVAARQPNRVVIPFLVRLLGDPGQAPELRVQAAESLAQLGFGASLLPAIVKLLRKDRAIPAALLVDAYAERPEPARAELAKLMSGVDDATRTAAFWTAAALRDPELRKPLEAGLDDPVLQVRLAAAWALGELGDPASATVLDKAAGDGNDQVAAAAAAARRKVDRGGK
ncbi:HEAT repeat domain-containing protein [Candidatus Binatia bacterium]|nr:HEAT repeat domain-containing protein [Candidatus Binatia bacterium]